MANHCVAFIDPIISPVYLATELRRYSIKTVAIFTLVNLSEEEKKIRFHPELFDQVLYVDMASIDSNQINEIVHQLKTWGVECILYGYEGSIAFADKLSQLVCPEFANNPQTSIQRFDKYEMQEALKKANLPSVNQIQLTHFITGLENWNFPVILKPNGGSASIGIKICHSVDEIDYFLKKNHPTLLHGTTAKSYIMQELLIGEEYIVDTFSLRGEHQVVSVHRYKKTIHEGYLICRYSEIVDPGSIEWKSCADYILGVLDVVGLKNGFGHSELFLTQKGPRLVEVNARISGAAGFVNKLSEKTLHFSQPAALFNALTKQPHPPFLKMTQTGLIVCVQNWKPRKISTLNATLLSTLSSYKECVMLKTPGAYLTSPKTLLDTVAMVLLINKNKKTLMEDYAQLTEWEKNEMLF